MKFFFKVFFTTMFLVVACTAVAGYLLIRDNVSSLLESETMATVESGSVAAYALSAADPNRQFIAGANRCCHGDHLRWRGVAVSAAGP